MKKELTPDEKRTKRINKYIIIVALAIIAVPVILYLLFIFIMINTGGTTTSSDSNKYEDIFDDELFGFEKNQYQSALIAFPRTKPDNIIEFYYSKEKKSKPQDFIIYLAYKLSHDEITNLFNNLSSYEMTFGEESHKPIVSNDDFYYSTIIFTFQYHSYEYVMFDFTNDIVLNVYGKGEYLSTIDRISDYCISPIKENFIYKYVIENGMPSFNDENLLFNKYGCFEHNDYYYYYSIYQFEDKDAYKYIDINQVEIAIK